MTDHDVLRYLHLVDRKLTIMTSGIHWKPEYETELKNINKDLCKLRMLMDEEYKRREENRPSTHNKLKNFQKEMDKGDKVGGKKHNPPQKEQECKNR
ncbi:MAG: hypothetical protein OSJ61_17555 [Lachnospiraceae bacterium]|jgi:hypothetical protein|nr:hypothetical protein [Lachnospiraceae bacterium]